MKSQKGPDCWGSPKEVKVTDTWRKEPSISSIDVILSVTRADLSSRRPQHTASWHTVLEATPNQWESHAHHPLWSQRKRQRYRNQKWNSPERDRKELSFHQNVTVLMIILIGHNPKLTLCIQPSTWNSKRNHRSWLKAWIPLTLWSGKKQPKQSSTHYLGIVWITVENSSILSECSKWSIKGMVLWIVLKLMYLQ